MANAYVRKSSTEIAADIDVLTTIAQPGDVYGLSAADIANLKAHRTSILTAATNLANAIAAVKGHYHGRDILLAAAQAAMQSTATVIYAQSAVNDAQLATVGLAPRRSGSVRPYPPARVGGLVASPVADGTVKLAWDRMGNPKSATFVVETSADGQNWTYLTSTSRITFLADGFAPGVPAWFRVTAKTATALAVPSTSVSVYAPEAPARVELKLAA